MSSIEKIKDDSGLRIKEMNEYRERSEHILEEIDKVKEAVRDIDGLDLDRELQDAIKEAEDAARDEAGKDGEELVEAQSRTVDAIDKLNEVIGRKEEDYDVAIYTLKKLDMNDYKRPLENPTKKAEDGTKELQDTKENLNREMQENMASVQDNLRGV